MDLEFVITLAMRADQLTMHVGVLGIAMCFGWEGQALLQFFLCGPLHTLW